MHNITYLPYFVITKNPVTSRSKLFIVDEQQIKTNINIELPPNTLPFKRALSCNELTLRQQLNERLMEITSTDSFFQTLEYTCDELVNRLVATKTFSQVPQLYLANKEYLNEFEGLPAYSVICLGKDPNKSRTILVSEANQGFECIELSTLQDELKISYLLIIAL